MLARRRSDAVVTHAGASSKRCRRHSCWRVVGRRCLVPHAGASSKRNGPCCFQPVVSSQTVGGFVGAGVATRYSTIQACFEIGSAQPVNHAPLENGSTQYLLNFFSAAWCLDRKSVV